MIIINLIDGYLKFIEIIKEKIIVIIIFCHYGVSAGLGYICGYYQAVMAFKSINV